MNAELSSELLARARVHAALGEPARLAIVDTLVWGDASPGEVSRRLGLPTNLVAHHVKVLQEAGMVERFPSEGDRRRTYLRLRPGALDHLTPSSLERVPRVVFVCTQNSARSQLAAALWARSSSVPAASAGTDPAPRVHPRAVRVGRRHGLALGHARTARLDDVVRPDDLVIAVCDKAYEDLGDEGARRLHWSVPDPAPTDTDEAFEAAFSDIADRVQRLTPVLHPPGGSDD
jgi:protein-tyrosine-phosphatase/DNA-binding transcriptional ArsR family regulator